MAPPTMWTVPPRDSVDHRGAANTPFFGGGKLVWLKSANFLSDDVKGKSVNVLEPLEELGAILKGGLPDDVTFLLSAIDPDKRRSFYKTLTKLADTQIFDEPDLNRSGWEENAGEIVRTEAKKRSLEFEEEALELFVLSYRRGLGRGCQRAGKSWRFMDRRVRSRSNKYGIGPDFRAAVIFELGNALARRNATLALSLVRAYSIKAKPPSAFYSRPFCRRSAIFFWRRT
jgi:DNA polymerase-3 subunit delta